MNGIMFTPLEVQPVFGGLASRHFVSGLLLTGFTINFVTLVAGIVTVLGFFREMRRENGRLLKHIREGQQRGFEALAQILKDQALILKDHTVLFEKMLGRN